MIKMSISFEVIYEYIATPIKTPIEVSIEFNLLIFFFKSSFILFKIKIEDEMNEGEMYGKSNMDIYITICKIDGQWEFVVCLRKLKEGLCQTRGVESGER